MGTFNAKVIANVLPQVWCCRNTLHNLTSETCRTHDFNSWYPMEIELHGSWNLSIKSLNIFVKIGMIHSATLQYVLQCRDHDTICITMNIIAPILWYYLICCEQLCYDSTEYRILHEYVVFMCIAIHFLSHDTYLDSCAGIILCMRPTNWRRRYIVTSPLIGLAHTRNDLSKWCIAIYTDILV